MIRKISKSNDIETIVKLAQKIWREHYTPIIGQNQVNYMLDKFQSFDAISSQIKNGYEYFLISNEQEALGYLCLISDTTLKKLMISKIYVDKKARGTGFGIQLIDFTKNLAREKGMKLIWLTVNKYNSNSIGWYQKLNFKVVNEIKMDIGNDYIMDDYVLELLLD